MTQRVTVDLTWPQLALVRDVLAEFVCDDHVIYGQREVGLANRALDAILAAEHRWYAQRGRGLNGFGPLPPSRQIPERTGQ